MSSNRHSLEPFPIFVDAKKPSPYDHFSKMGIMGLLSPASVAELRRQRTTASKKISNYLYTYYYRYELTFGIYVMTGIEKAILNTLVLSILAAIAYGLYVGFQPFVVRSICHLIYYLNGTMMGVEDICAEATCS